MWSQHLKLNLFMRAVKQARHTYALKLPGLKPKARASALVKIKPL